MTAMQQTTKAYLMIAVGASFWGLIGLFVAPLHGYGFTSLQVVALRAVSAAFLLLLYTAIRKPALLKVAPVDLWYFIGTGVISIVFFNWAFFATIDRSSLSIAVVLLYTGPTFVTVLSYFIFKEPLTKRKISALVSTIIGCALVTGAFPGGEWAIPLNSLFIGLASGFFFGLYSIFGKAASRRYSSLTISTYTFIFAGVAVVPFSGLSQKLDLLFNAGVWLNTLGLSLVSTVLAYFLYTLGLSWVESSRASILATLEPVVATLIGLLVFGDMLTIWQGLGVILVVSAVILVAEHSKKVVNQEIRKT